MTQTPTARRPRTPDQDARNRFYASARWRKFRAWFLAQHPKCAECEKRDLFVPAVHLDHIIPLEKAPERATDPNNVQGLCVSCHTGKTNTERTGRPFKHWSDKRVGVDGIPFNRRHELDE